MPRIGKNRNKKIEKAISDILKSKARTRIYLFLLKNKKAKTEHIIKGTKLHPSTVRETLSKMHEEKLIIRKKIKNDSIGKNPFEYYPIPPINLLKKYTNEMEDRLNKIANLSYSNLDKNPSRKVKIKIYEEADLA